MTGLSHPLHSLLTRLGTCAQEIVSNELRTATASERSRALGHAGSDVIYAIDQAVEAQLVQLLEAEAEALGGIVLIAEGIGENEKSVYPKGFTEDECTWRLLVDPIDGTRGIMMDKRSAWFIAGAAPNRGEDTRLRQTECSILAELPTSRAGFADELTAVKGQGVRAKRKALLTDDPDIEIVCEPYSGESIKGGFAQIVRFFPGGREVIAELEEALWERLFPDRQDGEILGFEDQYISTGGQWVELIMGRDRFCADLRGTLFSSKHFQGKPIGHTCHPYDMAGWLIAEESGILLTDPSGAPLDAPFDTRTACDWIGYANEAIRKEVGPVLRDLLKEQNWVES